MKNKELLAELCLSVLVLLVNKFGVFKNSYTHLLFGLSVFIHGLSKLIVVIKEGERK